MLLKNLMELAARLEEAEHRFDKRDFQNGVFLLGAEKRDDREITLKDIRVFIAELCLTDNYQTVQTDQQHYIGVSFQIFAVSGLLSYLPVVIDLGTQLNRRMRTIESQALCRSFTKEIVQKGEQLYRN